MKIAAFSIADYCEATEGMPHDVERLYFRMIMKMFSRESALPDDDRDNARMFGYDVRTYKRLKAKLLAWPNALYVEGSELRNARAESDIAEAKERKRWAAANGKLGGKSNGLQRKIKRTSARLRPNFDQKLPHISHTTSNKNNDLAEPSPTPSPTPSPKVAATQLADDDLQQLQGRLLNAANGALDNPVNCMGLLAMNEPRMWLEQGCDLERDIIPTLIAAGQKHNGKRIRSWGYFTGMVTEAKQRRERGLPTTNCAEKPKSKAAEILDRWDAEEAMTQ